MAKTYLQLVNDVLTRLKQDTAISVNDNEDTRLVGSFVNEAKTWLEDSHNWSFLRTTVQINTLADGTFAYSITGAGTNSNILQIINDTTDFVFKDATPYKEMNALLTQNNQDNAEPTKWDLNGVDGNGDAIINFHPKPNAVYTININLIKPQDPLESDSDVLLVPHQPVFLYALALAVEERGEEGGPSAALLFDRATTAANKAMTIDNVTQWDEEVMEII